MDVQQFEGNKRIYLMGCYGGMREEGFAEWLDGMFPCIQQLRNNIVWVVVFGRRGIEVIARSKRVMTSTLEVSMGKRNGIIRMQRHQHQSPFRIEKYLLKGRKGWTCWVRNVSRAIEREREDGSTCSQARKEDKKREELQKCWQQWALDRLLLLSFALSFLFVLLSSSSFTSVNFMRETGRQRCVWVTRNHTYSRRQYFTRTNNPLAS